jgi:DNA-binding GntR family transcriptional regulator
MQLAPGAPLNEKELTQVYGVSRTPIREALIRLAEEGLVEIFPQSGTFVGRIPRGGLAEAVVVRMALEGAAVAHAITAAREADLARIAAIIGRQRDHLAQNNQDAFHAEDEAFHAALADAAGHPGLWRIAQQAKVQIDRCRRLTLPVPGRMQTVIDEHEAIVAALRRRDLAAASAAMERHLSAVIPDAADISQSYPEYFL